MSQPKTNKNASKLNENMENKLVTNLPSRKTQTTRSCNFCTMPPTAHPVHVFNRRKLPVEKNTTTSYFQAPDSCFITVREIEETIDSPVAQMRAKEEQLMHKKKLHKKRSMTQSEIERECELYRQLKIELQEEFKGHIREEKQMSNNKRNLSTVGPHWYQELSYKQIMYVSALEASLVADMEEGILIRLQQVITGLGVWPRPTNGQIKNAAEKSFLNPILFLAYLYKYTTKEDNTLVKKDNYSVNERLLLSGLAFLALPTTLIDLQKRIPATVADLETPQYPEEAKRYKPKDYGVKSPYLDPQPVYTRLWQLEQEKVEKEKILFEQAAEDALRTHNVFSVHNLMRMKSKSKMQLAKASSINFSSMGVLGRRQTVDSIQVLVQRISIDVGLNAPLDESVSSTTMKNEVALSKSTSRTSGAEKSISQISTAKSVSQTSGAAKSLSRTSGTVKSLSRTSGTVKSLSRTSGTVKSRSTHGANEETDEIELLNDTSSYSELDTLQQVFSLAFNSITPNTKPKIEVPQADNKVVNKAESIVTVPDDPARVSPSTELPPPIPTEATISAVQAGYWAGNCFNVQSDEPTNGCKSILQAALADMAQQGNILAALPHSDKLPGIKLWYKYRDGHKLTESKKEKLMMQSINEWEQLLALPRIVKPPNLKINKELNWFQKEWLMKHVRKVKSGYISKVKQAAIHDTREYWPPMYMYDFHAPAFKSVYFAYLPAREEDLFLKV